MTRAALAFASAAALAGCGMSARETDLQKAVKGRDVEAVRRLVASGATVGPSLENEDSPYELALEQLSPGEPATVEILRLVLTRMDAWVASGEGVVGVSTTTPPRPADAFFKSDRPGSMPAEGLSAVEIAARQSSVEGVRLLVEHGLTVRSDYVSDALVAAAANGGVPVLRLLLDAGAEVDRPDRQGDTALAMARRVRSASAAAFLLGRGARAREAEKGLAQKGAEAVLSAVYAPGDDNGAASVPAGEKWLEGSEVLGHPAGRAAVSAGVSAASIETGSVLVVRAAAAELQVAEPGDASAGGTLRVAGTTKHTMTLIEGTWTLGGDVTNP